MGRGRAEPRASDAAPRLLNPKRRMRISGGSLPPIGSIFARAKYASVRLLAFEELPSAFPRGLHALEPDAGVPSDPRVAGRSLSHPRPIRSCLERVAGSHEAHPPRPQIDHGPRSNSLVESRISKGSTPLGKVG